MDPNLVDGCYAAVAYKEYTPLKAALCVIVILCFLSIVTSMVYFAKYMCSVLHHANYKVLLSLYLISFIAHSIFLGSIQAYHLFKLTFSEPCDLIVTNHFCYWFRHPTNSLMTLMSFTQFAITIERCIAAKLGSAYDKQDAKLGIIFAIICIICSEAFSIRQQWPKSETIYCYYCSSAQLFNRSGPLGLGSEWFLVCMITDLLSLAITILLAGHYYIAKKTRVYSVAERFERVRNTNVLAGLVPTIAFHSFYLVVFMVIQLCINNFATGLSDVAFKTLAAAANIIPIYTALAPALMMYMQSKDRQSTSVSVGTPSGEEYFDKLDEQWNKVEK